MTTELSDLFPPVETPVAAVRARVIVAPATSSDQLFVAVDAFDGSRQQWGPCPWSPSTALPQLDDDVLVIFDELQTPWVMTLAPILATSSGGYLDGGEPDSNYGAIDAIDGGSV
jgi:hypothetical protein